jgi:hypothetical protein
MARGKPTVCLGHRRQGLHPVRPMEDNRRRHSGSTAVFELAGEPAKGARPLSRAYIPTSDVINSQSVALLEDASMP